MQYIDQNTTPRTNIQRQNDPTTLEKEWPATIDMSLTITTQKDLEYDLTSQKRTSLN